MIDEDLKELLNELTLEQVTYLIGWCEARYDYLVYLKEE